VKNNDVRQDPLENLADVLTEDILNTPDDEVLREVEEDFGDRRVLANRFDQILERAEKQVFGTARSPASPQVRSSVLDLPIRLPDETIRWVKGIFNLGSRLSEFLSSLTPRTLAWSATAAAVVILVQAAVITVVVVKEQRAPGAQQMAEAPGLLPLAGGTVQSEPRVVAAPPREVPIPATAATPKLSDEEIAALVAGGRQLMVAGDIPNARLALQPLAEIAGNASAALELGATYDPIELEKLDARAPVASTLPSGAVSVGKRNALSDIAMARTWYQKAKDLGSTEAVVRLENLADRDRPRR
jgi:hypothetical protein